MEIAPKHVLAYAVKTGKIIRVAPRLYALAGSDEDQMRLLAAARRVHGFGAFSHTTALAMWGIKDAHREGRDRTIHVTVPGTVQLRTCHRTVMHRRTGFRVGSPHTARRNGIDIVRLERAIAESWPLLASPAGRRACVILPVRDRRTTADRIHREATSMVTLKGRAQLLGLLDLLRDGCQSELEIWGYRQIFEDPALPAGRRQYAVRLPTGRMAYIDLAYEHEKVAVELDGAEYHFGVEHRERDMRRDSALSQLGWVVIRFSHHRLLSDPQGVRAEVQAILARRRHQLTRSRLP